MIRLESQPDNAASVAQDAASVLSNAAAELVQRSCALQGIPERLADAGTIARVAALLTQYGAHDIPAA